VVQVRTLVSVRTGRRRSRLAFAAGGV